MSTLRKCSTKSFVHKFYKRQTFPWTDSNWKTVFVNRRAPVGQNRDQNIELWVDWQPRFQESVQLACFCAPVSSSHAYAGALSAVQQCACATCAPVSSLRLTTAQRLPPKHDRRRTTDQEPGLVVKIRQSTEPWEYACQSPIHKNTGSCKHYNQHIFYERKQVSTHSITTLLSTPFCNQFTCLKMINSTNLLEIG